MEPSSSNTGFFQQQPVIKNQFHDDASLQRITKRMFKLSRACYPVLNADRSI
jgi:hypothetical protein